MARKQVKDYSDDDSTRTNSEIHDITECGCVVTERAYTEMDEDTLMVTQCIEITLEVPQLDIDGAVTRSLEDLQAECDGDVEFDI